MPVSWRRRAELGLLIALCVFLPLYEAPKNIVWLGYVAFWIGNRLAERDFGGPWDAWDTLIAAWIASGFLVAAFAGLHGSEWRAALDIVRYGSVLWIVKRSRLAEREVELVLVACSATAAKATKRSGCCAQTSASFSFWRSIAFVTRSRSSAYQVGLMESAWTSMPMSSMRLMRSS